MRNRKRVLIIARWPVGGIRSYFRYIYSKPIFESYRLTFVMPDIESAAKLITDNLGNQSYSLVLTDSSGRALYKFATDTLKKEKFDLIHTHGFTAGIIGLFLQIRFRLPHLMTMHDVFSESDFRGLKGYFKKKLVSQSLQKITMVMSVGSDANRNLHEFFPNMKGKSRAIRNGIPTRYFYDGKPRALKQELCLADDVFLIGFFGRFMSLKGFRYLADAIQELSYEFSPYRIRVVCFGWGGFIREEQEQLKDKKIEDYFIFMPQTDDMPAVIKGVDLVAMPSISETCPLLPMEVLSAGVPIVGTSCIGSREVFDDTPAYVVVPRSVDGLVTSIKSEMFAPSKEKFESFAKIAVLRFSDNQCAEQLEQLFCELIMSPIS